jgi:hypothetical protein
MNLLFVLCLLVKAAAFQAVAGRARSSSATMLHVSVTEERPASVTQRLYHARGVTPRPRRAAVRNAASRNEPRDRCQLHAPPSSDNDSRLPAGPEAVRSHLCRRPSRCAERAEQVRSNELFTRPRRERSGAFEGSLEVRRADGIQGRVPPHYAQSKPSVVSRPLPAEPSSTTYSQAGG